MHLTPTEPHYLIAPAVFVARLDEANNIKWVAQEGLGTAFGSCARRTLSLQRTTSR